MEANKTATPSLVINQRRATGEYVVERINHDGQRNTVLGSYPTYLDAVAALPALAKAGALHDHQ
jgi:hypothetical protein